VQASLCCCELCFWAHLCCSNATIYARVASEGSAMACNHNCVTLQHKAI
jgi:hypothetical protein